MMPLVDGLSWFVSGGLAVGILVAWVKALDVASRGQVSALARAVATFVLLCGILGVIVWLDIQAKMGS